MHAWYSQKQAELYGTVIYLSADSNQPIEVSSVTDSKDNHGLVWSDLEYIGPVTKFLKLGIRGQMKLEPIR